MWIFRRGNFHDIGGFPYIIYGKNRDPPKKTRGFGHGLNFKIENLGILKVAQNDQKSAFLSFCKLAIKGICQFLIKVSRFFQNFEFFVFFLVLTTAQWGKIDFSKNWNFEFTPLNSHVMCVFSWNMMGFSNLGFAS